MIDGQERERGCRSDHLGDRSSQSAPATRCNVANPSRAARSKSFPSSSRRQPSPSRLPFFCSFFLFPLVTSRCHRGIPDKPSWIGGCCCQSRGVPPSDGCLFPSYFFFVVLSLPFSPSCSLVSLLSSPFLLFYPQSQRSHGQTRPLPCLSSRTLSFCFPLVFVSLRPSRRRSSFANADTYFVHWLADPVPGPTCDLSSSQLQAISQANSAPRTRSSLRFPVAATLLLRLLRRRKEPV